MKSFNIIITFVIFAGVVNAHSAISYVNRHDGGINNHNYHQHSAPLLISSPVVYGTHAGSIEHSWNPIYSAGYAPHYHKDYHHYPKYKFEYGVKDVQTGDHKSQWEVRDGDVVKGEYTLDEADGTKRIVSYAASDKTGFNAVVKKIGNAYHYQPYANDHSHSHSEYAASHSYQY